jgi:ficolin
MKQQPSGFTPITVNGITMSIYCDQTTDGGGWEIFQRRASTSVDFYRGWNDYKDGFGDNSNWWLGNTRINLLTTAGAVSGNTELRVDMADGSDYRYAKYTNFQIGDASTKYQISVSGYSGDAGDDMSGMSGYPFSTHDQDNDSWSSNCAVSFKGAWWYTACHSSNLNAVYHNGAHSSYADGVNWHSFKGHYYSLSLTEMKTRIGGKPTSNCGMMQVYQSCTQAKQAGNGASGEFCIQPGATGNSFKVQCDMTTDGGGWEVFQRRADGSVDFYNTWHTYVEGLATARSTGLASITSPVLPASSVSTCGTAATTDTQSTLLSV